MSMGSWVMLCNRVSSKGLSIYLAYGSLLSLFIDGVRGACVTDCLQSGSRVHGEVGNVGVARAPS